MDLAKHNDAFGDVRAIIQSLKSADFRKRRVLYQSLFETLMLWDIKSEQGREVLSYCADFFHKNPDCRIYIQQFKDAQALRIAFLEGDDLVGAFVKGGEFNMYDDDYERTYNDRPFDDVRHFKAWPTSMNLKSLTFDICAIEEVDELFVPILQQGDFTQLESLTIFLGINYNPPHPDAVAVATAISENSTLANLSSLGLYDSGLGNAGVHILAQSPYLRPGYLNLGGHERERGNNISLEGAQALAQSEILSNVHELNLSWNETFLDDALEALLASPHLKHLTSLDLSITGLSLEGTHMLAEWPGIANITSLQMICRAGDTEAQEILTNSLYTSGICFVQGAHWSGYV